jgi:Family of unknown function (DUF5984)
MSYQTLFDFQLHPPAPIKPTGEGDDQQFNLTHLYWGQHWINVGEFRLLEYSDHALRFFESEVPCVDYMLDLFYRELMANYDSMMRSIPEDLIRWMQPDPVRTGFEWENLLGDIYEKVKLRGGRWETFTDTIIAAFCERHLDFAYLQQKTDVRIWSDEKEVFIGWSHRDHLLHGKSVWTAPDSGAYAVSRECFQREIIDFHERFLLAQQRQIDVVNTFSLSENVRNKLDQLQKRLDEDCAIPSIKIVSAEPIKSRTYTVGSEKFRSRVPDWEEVRSALRSLQLVAIS